MFIILTFVVGYKIVNEISESNNLFSLPIQLLASPDFNNLEDIVSCNLGLTKGIFDFSEYEGSVKTNPGHLSTFYSSEADALNFTNQIIFLNNFEALQTPKTIWVRIEDHLNGCFSLTSFKLLTKNCPPIIYNAVSPDNDGLNDFFFIDGLRDIFLNFKLEIYNRWGRLIWTGNNNKPDWNGYSENTMGNNEAPSGTYYYILYLNDPDYPKPINGFLHLKR